MAISRLETALGHLDRLFTTGSLVGLSDGQLLERFVSRRDEDAFTMLVERHAPMVLAVCRRSLKNPGEIDDAFQATFLILARRPGSVQKRDSGLGGVAFWRGSSGLVSSLTARQLSQEKARTEGSRVEGGRGRYRYGSRRSMARNL